MSTKGTIIYLGGFELPNKNAAAQRVISNSKALREMGYKVVLIGVDKSLSETDDINNTKTLCMGFESYSIPYTNQRLISIERVRKVIEKHKSTLSHIIVYNYPAIAFLKVLAFAHKNGIKVISDCTEWYEATGKNIVAKAIKAIDVWIRMHILNYKSDGLIAISGYLYNYYSRKVNTVYIPPLVDISEEKWNRTVSLRDDERISLVYSGSPFGKDKIEEIAEAVCNFDNLVFYIIGVTEDQFEERFPEIIKKIDDRVQFLGRLDHETAIGKIREADFTIFSREITKANMAGFPTKFVESITCGTPVITNLSSDIGMYLTHGINGFVITNSILETLAEVAEKQHSEIKEMKQNVDNSLFDYHKYFRQFEQIIG